MYFVCYFNDQDCERSLRCSHRLAKSFVYDVVDIEMKLIKMIPNKVDGWFGENSNNTKTKVMPTINPSIHS